MYCGSSVCVIRKHWIFLCVFRWLKFYCFLALGPKGENGAQWRSYALPPGFTDPDEFWKISGKLLYLVVNSSLWPHPFVHKTPVLPWSGFAPANVKELSDEELLINCLPGHYYLEIKKGHFTTIIQDIDVLGIYVTVGVHDSKWIFIFLLINPITAEERTHFFFEGKERTHICVL